MEKVHLKSNSTFKTVMPNNLLSKIMWPSLYKYGQLVKKGDRPKRNSHLKEKEVRRTEHIKTKL